jgi:uncharacterized protein
VRPLGFGDVVLDPDGFWGAAQRRNGEVTIPHAEGWLERVGSIANFDPETEREGLLYTDSDVFKLLEAMVWESARSGDGELARRTEALTAQIARSLEPDGYLNTYWSRRERYTNLQTGHELYCHGHLIQAAVAAARTGAPAALAELGRAVGDHVSREFGPDGPRQSVDGHPEIELALVELARVTGERRYLDTAQAIVDRRGHGVLGEVPFDAAYFQDAVPVRDTEVLHGHAVRALYLAAGAADVAVETGDAELFGAVQRQWHATVARRTYITGGMGSRPDGEAFGDDFELPPDTAYSETCAGVAAVMLAWRLLLATGDEDYADQLERTLHNVVLTSPSREGDAFFYVNPLRAREPRMREAWFACACCPPNVARLLASLGGYVATTDEDGVQLHLYAAGSVRTAFGALAVRTDYPWAGEIDIEVEQSAVEPWTLSLRVPAWADGATVTVDGAAEPVEPGVVHLLREWRPGDVVRLSLPVAPRFTLPDPRIEAVRGCVAVERGPLVYCAEAFGGDLERIDVQPRGAEDVPVDGMVGVRVGELTLVPYFTWANRGPSTMRVWLPLAG